MTIHPPGLSALSGRRFEAVLFDLDGTFIDSTPAVDRSWRRWAVDWGVPLDGFVVPHGVPARQVLPALVLADQLEAAYVHLEALEVQDVEGIVVLPGAAAALGAVPADRAAIVTSGSTALATARIAATGLAAPRVLVTADDVPVGKPQPDPYLLAARRLGVDPAACVVVEDAPAGLAAGRAAGCFCVALTTTHGSPDANADLVLDSLADVRFVAAPGGVRIETAIAPAAAVGAAG